jgi:putative transposase
MHCAVVVLAAVTNGTGTRSSSRFAGKSTLWRAVDQDGNVLDILVQSRRHKKAAKRFFRKLLKGLHYVPRVIITDKLRSYGAAKRDILPGVEHRQHKG